jgi:hypothetical protein
MLIGVGVMAGTLLAGKLPVVPGRRFGVLAGAYGASLLFWALLIVLVSWGQSLVLAGLSGFLIGISLGVSTVHFASALNDVVPSDRRGVTLGTVNMIVFITVIVFQWGTGVVMNLFPGSEPGTYTPKGFLVAFTLTTAILVAGSPFLTHIRKAQDSNPPHR